MSPPPAIRAPLHRRLNRHWEEGCFLLRPHHRQARDTGIPSWFLFETPD